MNLSALHYNVKVVDAQFGVATDGDASKCCLVYSDGVWMNAQDTMLALLWHLHHQKRWRGSILKVGVYDGQSETALQQLEDATR